MTTAHNRWLLYYFAFGHSCNVNILAAIYLHYPHLQRLLVEMGCSDQVSSLNLFDRAHQAAKTYSWLEEEGTEGKRAFEHLDYTVNMLNFKPTFDTWCKIHMSRRQGKDLDRISIQWWQSLPGEEKVGHYFEIEHRCASLFNCSCASSGQPWPRSTLTGHVGLRVHSGCYLINNRFFTYNDLHLCMSKVFGPALLNEIRQQEHIVRFFPYPEDKFLPHQVHTFDLDKARATTRPDQLLPI